MDQQSASDSSQHLIDWHNRTVRLLSARFGTKKSRSKKLPKAAAAAATVAPQCGEKGDPTSAADRKTTMSVLSVELPESTKLGAESPPRLSPAKDEQAALDRIKLLLLEASDELSSVDSRRAAAVRRYGDLYTTAWPAARRALDGLESLKGMENLKDKIMLSVMVLSYRDCSTLRAQLQEQIDEAVASARKVGISVTDDDLEKAFLNFLQANADKYNYQSTVQDVLDRLASTLYEYPLRTCKELRIFADQCADVAWALCTVSRVLSSCPLINCDDGEFNEGRHIRKEGSDASSQQIAGCVWPSLLDGKAETCLHRGVVITH